MYQSDDFLSSSSLFYIFLFIGKLFLLPFYNNTVFIHVGNNNDNNNNHHH